ncbi:MAG: bifunctional precorrin-2 dehydrogenase/sirohydrochlorin ferrochelatase [Bacteroidota bacterium]
MDNRNQLYPVFLKVHTFNVLIVGGGEVGEEKLHNLLKSSPQAKVRLVAPEIKEEIREMAARSNHVELIQENFCCRHLEGIQMAIIATEKPDLNREIRDLAKSVGILTNVADTPELCDFYMGSIVTKGDLKIGISTNGKSPTFAKRFRELLEDVLSDDIPSLLNNLRVVRDRLKGDFSYKVERLNEITKDLVG